MIGLVVALFPTTASGQTTWERTPYRIHVILALAQVPDLGPRIESDLLTGLIEQSESVMGPAWDLQAQTAPPPMRHRILQSITSLDVGDLDPELFKHDKIIVISVRMTPDRFKIVAREFDCPTRRWELPVIGEARQPTRLREELFRTLLASFAPLARIEINAQRQIVLKPRAADMPIRDPSITWFHKGDVFQPIIRRNHRDGNPRENGIQPLPWAFLVVQEVSGSQITCKLHRGTRQSLRVRRRGRVQQFALAVKTPATSTQLLLRARTDPDLPLSGYDVYARGPDADQSDWIGRTDHQGALEISPDAYPLRILYVKNGDQLLARLPLVPGLTPSVVAAIADDTVRLETEGFLTGLQEDLIDLVARREILIARIHHRLDADDTMGAAEQLETLKRLPTREQFLQTIAQWQTQSVSKDPAVQSQLDKLFQETRTSIARYLDPRQIYDAQTLLNRARNAEQASPQHPASTKIESTEPPQPGPRPPQPESATKAAASRTTAST